VLARVIDAAAWAGSRLPSPVAHRVADIGGHLEWALRPGKRTLLAANLAHAIGSPASSPAVRQAVRREIVHEAHRSADLLWALGKPHQFLDTLEVIGADPAKAALATGRGLVLAGLHLGGWEVAGAAPAAVLPVPTSVIVADNWLAWAIQHRRTAARLRIIYRHQAALAAVHALRRGEAVLILGEDATGAPPRRYAVRFGDGVAHLPAGLVALARLASAPIVPFAVLPNGHRTWRAELSAPIAPPAAEDDEQVVLQRVADRWTELIRAHPDHWSANFPIAWEPPE